MVARLHARIACRNMVDLLALAHDRACEGELAERVTLDLDGGRLPDMTVLRALFMPDIAALPEITVSHVSLSLYDELANVCTGAAA